jgi:hypothetical protein
MAKDAAEVAIVGTDIPRRHTLLGGLELDSKDGFVKIPDVDSHNIFA